MKFEIRQCNSKKCMGTMTNHFTDPKTGGSICGRCASLSKPGTMPKFLQDFFGRKK